MKNLSIIKKKMCLARTEIFPRTSPGWKGFFKQMTNWSERQLRPSASFSLCYRTYRSLSRSVLDALTGWLGLFTGDLKKTPQKNNRTSEYSSQIATLYQTRSSGPHSAWNDGTRADRSRLQMFPDLANGTGLPKRHRSKRYVDQMNVPGVGQIWATTILRSGLENLLLMQEASWFFSPLIMLHCEQKKSVWRAGYLVSQLMC